jgi:hypothetical protein
MDKDNVEFAWYTPGLQWQGVGNSGTVVLKPSLLSRHYLTIVYQFSQPYAYRFCVLHSREVHIDFHMKVSLLYFMICIHAWQRLSPGQGEVPDLSSGLHAHVHSSLQHTSSLTTKTSTWGPCGQARSFWCCQWT